MISSSITFSIRKDILQPLNRYIAAGEPGGETVVLVEMPVSSRVEPVSAREGFDAGCSLDAEASRHAQDIIYDILKTVRLESVPVAVPAENESHLSAAIGIQQSSQHPQLLQIPIPMAIHPNIPTDTIQAAAQSNDAQVRGTVVGAKYAPKIN